MRRTRIRGSPCRPLLSSTPSPTRTAASLTDTVVDITARVSRAADDQGVLIATGNENCGLSFFVQNGRLVVDYNAFGDHTIVESSIEVPAGDSTLAAHLERDVSAGWVELSIDGTSGEVIAGSLATRPSPVLRAVLDDETPESPAMVEASGPDR